MDLVTRSGTLPGSDEARDFVGSDHGVELTLILISAPAGTAHRFINTGSDRLRLTSIHHAPTFNTEWLEPLPADQTYWSSETTEI